MATHIFNNELKWVCIVLRFQFNLTSALSPIAISLVLKCNTTHVFSSGTLIWATSREYKTVKTLKKTTKEHHQRREQRYLKCLLPKERFRIHFLRIELKRAGKRDISTISHSLGVAKREFQFHFKSNFFSLFFHVWTPLLIFSPILRGHVLGGKGG